MLTFRAKSYLAGAFILGMGFGVFASVMRSGEAFEVGACLLGLAITCGGLFVMAGTEGA